MHLYELGLCELLRIPRTRRSRRRSRAQVRPKCSLQEQKTMAFCMDLHNAAWPCAYRLLCRSQQEGGGMQIASVQHVM